MDTHKVPFHKMMFGKPLATYYVDDKAITPDNFASLDIQQLKGGLSGADVYRDGNIVHKTADNTPSVVKWYKISQSSSLKTPKVLKVVANTISLEYIDNNIVYFKMNENNGNRVYDLSINNIQGYVNVNDLGGGLAVWIAVVDSFTKYIKTDYNGYERIEPFR